MAGDEYESKEVVADVVIDRHVAFGQGGVLPDLEIAPDHVVLLGQQRLPTQEVDRPPPADGHEPGARVLRDAGLGPLLERRDERILGEILGEAHVADNASQPGDEPG
jgi:hypothetical protein